jgi:hypothetical protein
VIFLFILVTLTYRAQALGRPDIWREPIREVGWFGELPGWPGYGYYAGGYGPQMYGTYQPGLTAQGQYYVPQQPGTSLVIQPNANGMPPTVSHVPGYVRS